MADSIRLAQMRALASYSLTMRPGLVALHARRNGGDAETECLLPLREGIRRPCAGSRAVVLGAKDYGVSPLGVCTDGAGYRGPFGPK